MPKHKAVICQVISRNCQMIYSGRGIKHEKEGSHKLYCSRSIMIKLNIHFTIVLLTNCRSYMTLQMQTWCFIFRGQTMGNFYQFYTKYDLMIKAVAMNYSSVKQLKDWIGHFD